MDRSLVKGRGKNHEQDLRSDLAAPVQKSVQESFRLIFPTLLPRWPVLSGYIKKHAYAHETGEMNRHARSETVPKTIIYPSALNSFSVI